MPNWCENRLTVAGDKKQVDKFVEQGKTEDHLLQMSQFIPYLKKFADLDKKANKFNEGKPLNEQMKDGFNQGGYEWRIANWGTKWDLVEGELVREENTKAIYHFDTAWSSPFKFVKTVSKQFPELTFEIHYEEMGMMVIGTNQYKNGELIFENNFQEFESMKEYYQQSEFLDEEDYDEDCEG